MCLGPAVGKVACGRKSALFARMNELGLEVVRSHFAEHELSESALDSTICSKRRWYGISDENFAALINSTSEGHTRRLEKLLLDGNFNQVWIFNAMVPSAGKNSKFCDILQIFTCSILLRIYFTALILNTTVSN